MLDSPPSTHMTQYGPKFTMFLKPSTEVKTHTAGISHTNILEDGFPDFWKGFSHLLDQRYNSSFSSRPLLLHMRPCDLEET